VIAGASLLAGPLVYLLNLVSFNLGLYVMLISIGMVVFASFPVSEAYIVSNTSERSRSTVLGLYYFASRGGPGALMPVVGYLIDQLGFYTSFTIVGVTIFAVTVICTLYLWMSRS